jgi:hypothetical protein
MKKIKENQDGGVSILIFIAAIVLVVMYQFIRNYILPASPSAGDLTTALVESDGAIIGIVGLAILVIRPFPQMVNYIIGGGIIAIDAVLIYMGFLGLGVP